MDDTGVRCLAAALLKATHDDCRKVKASILLKHDNRRFLNSNWCKALCDGVDIDYAKYRETCLKELNRGAAYGD